MKRFGVKISDHALNRLSTREIRKLHSLVDYFEIQSPSLDVRETLRLLSVDGQKPKIILHSVKLSLASKMPPALSVLNKLREEAAWSTETYIGEHIGTLTPHERGPSLGYIIPPALTPDVVSQILRNTEHATKIIGKTLALENPVLYSEHSESSLDLLQFLQLLEARKTPFHWLLDTAHLAVYILNGRTPSLGKFLDHYKNSSRKIAEFHLASISQDKHGITHDNHTSSLRAANSRMPIDIYRYLTQDKHDINVTIEKDHSPTYTDEIELDLAYLRELPKHFCSPILSKNAQKQPSKRRALASETKGRKKMLSNYILSQLPATAMSAKKIIFTHRTISKLYREICAGNFSTPIPYYSLYEWDGVDILGPALTHVCNRFRRRPQSVKQKKALRRLLLEAAIRQAAIHYVVTGKRNPSVYLKTSGKCLNLTAGTYEIHVDSTQSISFIEATLPNATHNATRPSVIFDELSGVSQCEKEKRRPKQKPKSSATLSKQRLKKGTTRTNNHGGSLKAIKRP